MQDLPEATRIKICKLYYEEGLSKVEIAEKTRISRFKVAKILEDAVEEGIVEIKVKDLPGSWFELENRLEREYGIYRAVVCDSGSGIEQTKINLGAAAALSLSDMIQDGDCIGLAWGTTIYRMVEAFPKIDSRRNVSVIQLTGGLHQVSRGFNPVDLTSRLSEKIAGSSLFQLYAPAIVDNSEAKEILLKESTINETIKRFNSVNLAVVGIGSMSPKPSTMLYRDGFITDSQLLQVSDLGLAGDINSHFYDSEGRPCRTPFDDRTIGIDLEQLRRIRYVAALACGEEKVNAIRAALRGRIVNILATDRLTAESLLQEEG